MNTGLVAEIRTSPNTRRLTQKKGGAEAPPSLGRKRPRKQQHDQGPPLLRCTIYVGEMWIASVFLQRSSALRTRFRYNDASRRETCRGFRVLID
jgi:hypothetical protein